MLEENEKWEIFRFSVAGDNRDEGESGRAGSGYSSTGGQDPGGGRRRLYEIGSQ